MGTSTDRHDHSQRPLETAHDRVDDLATRATNTLYYTGTWIEYLMKHDRGADAIAFLVPRVDNGDALAASQLGDVLARLGRVDDAVALLRRFTYDNEFLDGDGPAALTLIEVMTQNQRTDDLRQEVNAGTAGAPEAWLTALLQGSHTEIEYARRLYRFGLNADGSAAAVNGTPITAG
jgi:hypothetical protein